MNESKAEGVFDELKGKVKQGWGELTGDQSTANAGAAEQVKGHAEETWGNVKDSAHDLTHSSDADRARHEAAQTGHNLRDNVTNAAENAKNAVERGLDNLKHKAND